MGAKSSKPVVDINNKTSSAIEYRNNPIKIGYDETQINISDSSGMIFTHRESQNFTKPVKSLPNSQLSADVGAAFKSAGLKIKTFRDHKKVEGITRQRLAMTLKGTVQQRRNHIRQGLDAEPIHKELVILPDGESLNDWLAVNTIHFFNIASMVYGTCAEFCSETSCPIMSAGAKFEYLWADGDGVKVPRQVSAPEYMHLLFDWIDEQISDCELFPCEDNATYSPMFITVVKTIFKRLFRMYGHVYYSHFDKICESGSEIHLNSSFQHFAFFVCEFKLVDNAEMRPLRKLLKKLVPGYQ